MKCERRDETAWVEGEGMEMGVISRVGRKRKRERYNRHYSIPLYPMLHGCCQQFDLFRVVGRFPPSLPLPSAGR